MSNKSDFLALLAANLPDNTSGSITPAKHREVFNASNFADLIAWLDELTSPALSFEYARIADGSTTPTAGEMSFNNYKNAIYFHKTDSNTNDLSDLLSDFDNNGGLVNIVVKAGTGYMVLKVSGYVLTGDIYRLSGTLLVQSIGGTTGDCVLQFIPYSAASTSSRVYSGTQLSVEGVVAGTTTPSANDFSLSDYDPDAAAHLYITVENTLYKSLFSSLIEQSTSNHTLIVFRPETAPDDFFAVSVDGAITWSGTGDALTADILLDETEAITTNNDYSLYQGYTLTIENK